MVITEVLRFLDYGCSHPAALSGYVDMVRVLPRALAARRQIQGLRLINDPNHTWVQPYPFAQKLRRRLTRKAMSADPKA